MPTLRQIECGIELGPGNVRLKEYGHKVTDGAVETYILAPNTNIPFHVRITSEGYIASGLAAYVFIDGEYQCNRNRLRLRLPEYGVSKDEYEIDFKLRQKEEKMVGGIFVARDWTFTRLDTGVTGAAPSSKNFKDNVGTIEVVILRCKDGDEEELSTDPTQTIVSRNPGYTPRATSVRLPVARATSAARAPSTRTPSTVKPRKDSSVGGMMGIFDGADDEPGYYKQYRPRNIIGQEHLPGHEWDPSSGQYRYFDDQDPFVNPRDHDGNRYVGTYPAHRYSPQAYTVGGGFSYQESVLPQEERPGGPKVYVPQSSPGYDFSARRRKVPLDGTVPVPKATYDFSRSTNNRNQETEEPRPRQESAHPRQATEGPRHRRESFDTDEEDERPIRRRDSFTEQENKKPRHRRESFHHEQENDNPRRRRGSVHHEYEQETEKPRHRREKVHHEQETERPRHRHENDRPQQTPEKPEQPEETGNGLAFIEYCSHQLRELIGKFVSEADKYDGLREDANRYHARRVIYAEILKAARRKHGEIVIIMGALEDVYDNVKAAMDGMGRETWRIASDFLFGQGLYPPAVFTIEPPVELDEDGKVVPPPSVVDDKEDACKVPGSWVHVGEGTAGDKAKAPTWDDPSPAKDNKQEATGFTWENDGTAKAKTDNGWGPGSIKSSVAASNKSPTAAAAKSSEQHVPGGWANEEDGKKDAPKWDEPAKADKQPGTGWAVPKARSAQGDDDWGADANKRTSHAKSSKSRHSGPVNDGAGSESSSYGDLQPKPVVKPYWSEWTKKQVTVKPKIQPRDVYEYPALPLPALPSDKIGKGITHAVHAGRGANYAHKLHRPEYLDDMSKPYAIFTFHYRNKVALEAILKHKVDDSNIGEAEAEAKKQALLSKSKDELIEVLMKKTSIAAQSKAAQSRPPTKVATNKNDDWGADKVATPRQSTSHRELPAKARATPAWNADVKPSDSVSQQGAGSGWGPAQSANKNKTVDEWRQSSKHTTKVETRAASRHTQKPDKAGGRDEKSKASWANAGWGNAEVGGAKSTATKEHFGSGDGLMATRPKKEKEVNHAGW